jgi:hypothetical protein
MIFNIIVIALLLIIITIQLRRKDKLIEATEALDLLMATFIESNQGVYKNQNRIIEKITEIHDKERRQLSELVNVKKYVDMLNRCNMTTSDLLSQIKTHADNINTGNRVLKEQNNSFKTKLTSLDKIGKQIRTSVSRVNKN